MIRGLMSDEEWDFFEPFVTVRGPKSGRPAKNHRLLLDGVFWIARTGAPWRDLPDFFWPLEQRLPPVSPLDRLRPVGRDAGSAQRERYRP